MASAFLLCRPHATQAEATDLLIQSQCPSPTQSQQPGQGLHKAQAQAAGAEDTVLAPPGCELRGLLSPPDRLSLQLSKVTFKPPR